MRLLFHERPSNNFVNERSGQAFLSMVVKVWPEVGGQIDSPNHFRPLGVEELAFGFVHAFVGVGTEALRGGGSPERTLAERQRPAGVSERRQRANQLALLNGFGA